MRLPGCITSAHAENQCGINSSAAAAAAAVDVLANLHLERLCQTCFGGTFVNVSRALAAWIKSNIKVDYFPLEGRAHTHIRTRADKTGRRLRVTAAS